MIHHDANLDAACGDGLHEKTDPDRKRRGWQNLPAAKRRQVVQNNVSGLPRNSESQAYEKVRRDRGLVFVRLPLLGSAAVLVCWYLRDRSDVKIPSCIFSNRTMVPQLPLTGELFYVDTDLHEDVLSTNRHDHGHLGGVSLEDIAQSMLSRKPGQFLKPESIAETEAASRSSSQDSGNTEDYTWQGRSNSPGHGSPGPSSAQAAATNPPALPRQSLFSLAEAQEWDSSKYEDCMDTDRSRQRSFSEPQLHRCQQHDRVPQHWLPSSLSPPQEGVASPPPTVPQRRASLGDERSNPVNNLQRALSVFFVDLWNRRVEDVSPHLSSCTSTKTFEVSNSTCDRDALARLGVAPDMSRGVGAMGSMTFTMHIATHR